MFSKLFYCRSFYWCLLVSFRKPPKGKGHRQQLKVTLEEHLVFGPIWYFEPSLVVPKGEQRASRVDNRPLSTDRGRRNFVASFWPGA